MATADKIYGEGRITELSEESVANTSGPMDFPEFTRGRWQTTQPIGVIGV
jgi:hypothetical protein